MKSSEKTLSEFFKRTIFQGLEKVDINQLEQRKSVYDAAFRSLDNVHSKNTNLPQERRIEQRNLLIQLVDEVEKQIVKLFEQEVTSSLGVEKDNPVYETEFSFDLEQENEKGIWASFKSKFSVLAKFKRLVILSVLAVLCLTTLLAFYANYSGGKDTVVGLHLPYEIVADEALLKSIKTKGSVNMQLIEGDQGGILYEVDFSNKETLNLLDVILREDLGKKFNAIREPILITFHVEKRSKEDLQLDLMARGSGRAVRKSVKILDQNTNEYFLVTNTDQQKKQRSNAIIRLQISPTLEKSEEKPALLIKKLVFSKI